MPSSSQVSATGPSLPANAARPRSSSSSTVSNRQQHQQPREILSTSRTTATNKSTTAAPPLADTISEVSVSSSVGWSGDYCKKMMALNWDYTAGPLRVVQVGPHNYHWARLHAPGHAVLPRADGTLQHFRETHKHVTDADLIRKVLESGVAKPRKDFKEKFLTQAKFSITDEDIDGLRDTLAKKSVPLPPARPPQTVFNRMQVYDDDCSSIFSRTDAGSVVSRRSASTTVAGKSDSRQFLRELSGTKAKHQGALQRQNQQSTDEDMLSNLGSTASSKTNNTLHRQQRPSSRQQAAEALSAARAERESVSSELQKAKEKLAQIEKIVEDHESSKRSSRQGSGRQTPSTSAVAKLQQQHRQPKKNSPALNQRELSNDLNVTRKALTPFC